MFRRAACLALLAALAWPSHGEEDREARIEADARAFEDFTLQQLSRRGVPGKKLGRDFREHLHATVLPAVRQAPDEFAGLPGYAGDMTKDDITELFLVLKDRPEGLADLVRGLLARLRRTRLDREAPKGTSPIPKDVLERWLAHRSILEGVTLDVLLGRMTSRYEVESELKSAGTVAAYAALKALGPSLDDVGGKVPVPPDVPPSAPVSDTRGVSLGDIRSVQAR